MAKRRRKKTKKKRASSPSQITAARWSDGAAPFRPVRFVDRKKRANKKACRGQQGESE